jgi:two-component system phosphate regulon sensor histidine kinase PhoR
MAEAKSSAMARTLAGLAVVAGVFGALAALAEGRPELAIAPLLGAVLGTVAGAVRPRRPPPPQPLPPPPPLQPALAQLAPLLEALPDPALLIDGEGRIAGSNAAARRQLQFEASGLRLSSIVRHPELNEAAQAAAQDGASRTVEYDTGAGAVEEHFRAYVAPVAWGQAAAALMVFHDQTAQVNSERMRSDFLANASHELKTPVSALSLMMETLSGHARNDPAAQARFLDMMRVQIERMRRLIEDLLSLSRIELNENVPPTDRADLSAIARECADAIGPVARDKGVRLGFVGVSDAAWVVGDRFQLLQVMQNLIDNAVKYAPTGTEVGIEIGAVASREEAVAAASRRWGEEAARIALLTPPPTTARGYIYVRVTDAGPGISRRHLPRLSERFYRIERDDGKERGGTGLGLAIVKHIVKRHRGGLVVESIVGKGSAFGVFVETSR